MSEGLLAFMLMLLGKWVVILSNKTAYCCKISVKKVQTRKRQGHGN